MNFNEPPGGFKRRIRPVIGDWAQVLPRRKQLPCRRKHSSHFPKVQARTLRQARNTENSPNDAATRGRFWPVKGNHGETEGTRGKHRETNGNQATLGVKLFIVPVLVSWQVHGIYMCGLWHQLISSPGVRPYLRPKQQPILQSPARLSSALARRRDLARPESPSPSCKALWRRCLVSRGGLTSRPSKTWQELAGGGHSRRDSSFQKYAANSLTLPSLAFAVSKWSKSCLGALHFACQKAMQF